MTHAFSRPWLLADIGGTNARFGWLAADSETPAHVQTFPTDDHPGPAAAARLYLEQLQQTLGGDYQPPHAAALAVATPIAGDHIAFTNSGWAFSRDETQRELKLDTLLVLNDFEALALSLPRLTKDQTRPWGQRVEAPRATRAVIGPGTGLGVAGLVPGPRGWFAIPGEGGHMTLAAHDDFESAVLALARKTHPHVSAERLISGIGMPLLHACVAAARGEQASELGTEEIVERALDGSDALCVATLDSFCALLGSFAGNVALVLGARGGVYIGGGIVPRLGDQFFASRFRACFEAKGRFEDYLKAVPTLLIKDTLAALSGAAQALAQHEA